ncbi:MAG: O-antigen polysaccharide polymerase Wzy [Deltaproteobacteria bacterium]|nr:O-antigen polysaccharide polymerase Wzy [Deltaproteobacteria bacterium]
MTRVGRRRGRPGARADLAGPLAWLLVAIGLGLVALLASADAVLAPGAAALATSALVATLTACNVHGMRRALVAPSMLFLAALTVFHLGMVVPVALGVAEPAPWLASADPDLVTRAVLSVALTVVAYELGCLAGWRTIRARPGRPGRGRDVVPVATVGSAPRGAPRPAPVRRGNVFHSGGLLVAGGAAAAILANVASIGAGRFFSASYGYALYAATDSRLLLTAFYWLLPTSALVTLVGARPGRETVRALGLLALVTTLLLWAGDRGGAVSLLSAAVVVWTAMRGPLPRKLVVPGALGLLLLMPVVATLRQLPRNGLDLEAIAAAATEASPVGALTEMGGSLRTLVETIRLVPEVTPYRLGGSYLDAALRIVPNVGLDKASHDWSDPASLPPNHWITYMVAPWAYASFGGLGFSAIAEPYLNFGLAGVVVYFFALGAALGWLDGALTRAPSRRFLAITAVVFMPLLVTVRNDFHNFLRPAAWGAGIVLLVEHVHGDRRARTRRMRPPVTIRAAEAA